MSNRSHDALCKAAERAIDAVHADTSVDVYQTLVSLKGLREHVDALIEATATDVRVSEEDDP